MTCVPYIAGSPSFLVLVQQHLSGRMILPPGIDMHLEPVWRGHSALTLPTGELWPYAAALGGPACAPVAFHTPSAYVMPENGQEQGILEAMPTLAVIIRVRPAGETISSIAFTFAGSLGDLTSVLLDAVTLPLFTVRR